MHSGRRRPGIAGERLRSAVRLLGLRSSDLPRDFDLVTSVLMGRTDTWKCPARIALRKKRDVG